MYPALHREPSPMGVCHGLDGPADEYLDVGNTMVIWEASVLTLAEGRNRLGGTEVCYSTKMNSKRKCSPLKSN